MARLWKVVCLTVYSDGDVEHALCGSCPAGQFRSLGLEGKGERWSVVFSPRAPYGVIVAQSWRVRVRFQNCV